MRKNVIASYVSQIYLAIVGVMMVPVYLRYMGAEAYGLVGFFAMLQAWFLLLDLGLTPTLTREAARYRGGGTDALGLRRLFRALEGIFFGIAMIGASALIFASKALAGRWLKVQVLTLEEVRLAIVIIAIIIAFRWVCGLYRGVINGFECLVWLGGFNIFIATLRFIAVVPFLRYVGAKPFHFFLFQLGVAVVEAVGLIFKAYRLLPMVEIGRIGRWDWGPLRSVLQFSLSIAFTSAAWVVATQTDKLVLSRLLPLAEYGYFTMAVMVAGGVGLLSGPISMPLLPNLARLAAEGDEVGLISIYRNATQLIGIIAVPAAVVLAFFARQVLWAWTGDPAIADRASRVLSLYALGNGIMAFGSFPYFLQYAKGDLKLHLIGSALFLVILMPGLYVATVRYGISGPGYAWVVTHLVIFCAWLPRVHRRFYKDLHAKWLLKDILPITLLAFASASLARMFVVWPKTRGAVALMICTVSVWTLVVTAFGSSWMRAKLRQTFLQKSSC